MYADDPARRHEFKASSLLAIYCCYDHRNLAKNMRWRERDRLKKLEAGQYKGKLKRRMLARGIKNLSVFEALRTEALEHDKSTKGATTLADIHYSVSQWGYKGVKKTAQSFERAEKLRPETMEGFVTPQWLTGDDSSGWLH